MLRILSSPRTNSRNSSHLSAKGFLKAECVLNDRVGGARALVHEGLFQVHGLAWRSVTKQKHKFTEIQRSQEPGSIAMFSLWASNLGSSGQPQRQMVLSWEREQRITQRSIKDEQKSKLLLFRIACKVYGFECFHLLTNNPLINHYLLL